MADHIEDPWIILVTDRTELGKPVYAVARSSINRQGKLKTVRRTYDVSRAWRLKTRTKAENAAKKLNSLDHGQLFTPARIEEGDFAKPNQEPAFTQAIAFQDTTETSEQ